MSQLSLIPTTTSAWGTNIGHSGPITLPENPWPAFFGEGRNGIEVPRYTGHASTWTLPEKYRGRNVHIEQTIEHNILYQMSWYKKIMPYVLTDQLEEEWDILSFKPMKAPMVPYLGNFRTVQYRRETQRARIERFGFAYEIEYDFMRKNPKEHFEILKQLAITCTEAVKADIIYSLINTEPIFLKKQQELGYYSNKTIDDVLMQQASFFAILQKPDRHPLSVLNKKVTELMALHQGMGDTWILDEKLQDYFQVVPKETTEYDTFGQTGVNFVLDQDKPLERLLGAEVFLARSLFMDPREKMVNYLQERYQLGEYFSMLPRHRLDPRNYSSMSRAIQVYSEELDQYDVLTLDWATKAAFLYDEKGDVIDYLSDHPNGPRFDLSAYSETEQNRDVFRYLDRHTMQYRNVNYLGEMEPDYFTEKNRAEFAESVVEAMKREFTDLAFQSLMHDWTQGISLLQRLERMPFTSANVQDVYETLQDTFVWTRQSKKELSPFLADKMLQDSNTGFVPLQPGKKLPKLIPGLQTWAGLNVIAESELPDAVVAKKFINVVHSFVQKFSSFLGHDNLLLDVKYAAKMWQFPTPESTFIEHLMSYQVPLFIEVRTDVTGEIPYTEKDERIEELFFNQPLFETLTTKGTDTFVGLDEEKLKRKLYISIMNYVFSDSKKLPPELANLSPEARFSASNERTYIINLIYQHRDLITDQKKQGSFNSAEKISDFFSILEKNFQEQWRLAQQARKSGSIPRTSTDVYQTPLVILPQSITAFANAVKDVPTVRDVFFPGHPLLPAIPMNRAEIEQYEQSQQTYWTSSSLYSFALQHHLGTQQNGGKIAGHVGQKHLGMKINDTAMKIQAHYQSAGARKILPKGFSGDFPEELFMKIGCSTFEWNWKTIPQYATDELRRMIAQLFNCCANNALTMMRFEAKNLIYPIGFIVARPHQTYITSLGIKCARGEEELGAVKYQPGIFMLADDAQNQKHIGTFSWKSKAMIRKPKNVHVARGIYVNKYIGGAGTEVIDPKLYRQGTGNFFPQSLIVIPVPYNFTLKGGVISLTGRKSFKNLNPQKVQQERALHIPICRVVANYGFKDTQQKSLFEPVDLERVSGLTGNNLLCMRGDQTNFDSHSQNFTIFERGVGHLAGCSYPGRKRVTDGDYTRFKSPDETQLGKILN